MAGKCHKKKINDIFDTEFHLEIAKQQTPTLHLVSKSLPKIGY